METKEIKQRLDDLDDLRETEYLTENEYRIARVNVLKECGVDVTPHVRKYDMERPGKDLPEREGCGCGCFLAFLLLLALIGAGIFYAAPRWPERFGGDFARQGREWISELWGRYGTFWKKQDGPSGASPAVSASEDEDIDREAEPVPVPSLPEAVPFRETVSEDIFAVPLPDALNSEAGDGDDNNNDDGGDGYSALPSPGMPEAPLLPDVAPLGITVPGNARDEAREEPDVTVIEVPPSLTVVPPSPAEPEEELSQGFISARRARIRTAPDTSTNANVVGWGRNGDRFTVLEEDTGRDGQKWYNVRFDEEEKQGWISSTLVTIE